MLSPYERFIRVRAYYANKLSKVYTREAKLLDDVTSVLKMLGLLYIREAFPTRRGTSDIIINAYGRFVAVELKDDTGAPSPQQLAFIAEVLEGNGIAGEVRTLDDLFNLLEKAIK